MHTYAPLPPLLCIQNLPRCFFAFFIESITLCCSYPSSISEYISPSCSFPLFCCSYLPPTNDHEEYLTLLLVRLLCEAAPPPDLPSPLEPSSIAVTATPKNIQRLPLLLLPLL
jgi:hypothetical protein